MGEAVQLEVRYPESDGEPLCPPPREPKGETDIHIEEMLEARLALKDRYRDDPQVYVAGNLLMYYEEGNPAARFSPDVFVVFGVPKHRRQSTNSGRRSRLRRSSSR